MSLPSLPPALQRADLTYAEPVVAADGTTVLPVSRVRRGTTVPVGVFVLADGRATWTPVVDADRIARIGVLTGFVAATLGCLAVLRRPPWPDTRITITRTH